MIASIDHFKQFLVYCISRGLVYGFHSSQPRMKVSFQGNFVSFEIPTTVEGFDELTLKVFPEKLGVSPCRFLPDTVSDHYKFYAKR